MVIFKFQIGKSCNGMYEWVVSLWVSFFTWVNRDWSSPLWGGYQNENNVQTESLGCS